MQIFSNPIGTSPWGAPKPQDAVSSSATSSTSDTSSTSSTDSATISANDFLELLVSEMKNQDPTADTDPNEYINQLVQVNSLQQLISINQDLTPTSSSSTGTGTSTVTGDVASQAVGTAAPPAGVAGIATTASLSTPNSGNSASRIATSLEKAAQTLAPSSSGGSLETVIHSMKARAQAHTSTSNPAH